MEEESTIIDISTLSVIDLLERAESNFAEMLYDKAKAFYQEAYLKNPDNEDLLCSYANFLTTIGEISLPNWLMENSACNYTKNQLKSYKSFIIRLWITIPFKWK